MTIYFKNGMTKTVNEEVAEIINKRLILENRKKWARILDDKGNLFLIVNINEIVCIS
jgi:hypothetical protein